MLALLILGGLASSFLIIDMVVDSDDDKDGSSDDEITLKGTHGDDELIADAPIRIIYGLDGDDDIDANGYSTTVYAGPGDDEVNGTVKDDNLYGELGDDTIYGGRGNDTFAGQDVYQMLEAVDGNYSELDPDALAQSSVAGNDVIYAGDMFDEVIDLHGSNELYGEIQDDYIVSVDAPGSEHAPDIVDGGFGSDTIIADDGDIVTGGGNYEEWREEYTIWLDEPDDEPVTITDFEKYDDIHVVIAADLIEDSESIEPVVTPVEDQEDTFLITVAGYDVAIAQPGRSETSVEIVETAVTVEVLG